ncbi:MAG: phosphatidylserine decarboxylase [Treponema sp.]|nr:phosphatidylserine decarboxylase [Treponema sp.]
MPKDYENLCESIDSIDELKRLSRISIQDLKKYIKNTLCAPPWEGFNNGDISDRINESLNYFYWLFGGHIDELGKYRPEPQYLEKISRFITGYVKLYGDFMDSTESWKPEYNELVCNDKRLKMEDYEEGYNTFNEFFTRRLKNGKRPIGEGFVSPVDGVIQNVHPINDGIVATKIKSSIYQQIQELIQEPLNNGTLISLFLDVYDYHRIHAPDDMTVTSIRKVKGGNFVGGFVEYINGKYVLDSSEYGWQSLETRVIVKACNETIGRFWIVPVGMSHVGSIEITCKEGDTIKKGSEIGLFKFGGSCVVIIIEAPIGKIQKKHFLMGERLL